MATVNRGPVVANVTQTSVRLYWRTDVATVCTLDPWGITTPNGTNHVADVTGLHAGSAYPYQVKEGATVRASGTFKTAPLFGTPFKAVVIGDSGAGSPTQVAIAALMEARKPDLMLHTSDVVYPTAQVAGNWLSRCDIAHFSIYATFLKRAPFYASLGGHDAEAVAAAGGQDFLDTFHFPWGYPITLADPLLYSVRWGCAEFFVFTFQIDDVPPNVAIDVDQVRLEALLAASNATWKVLVTENFFYQSGAMHQNNPTLRSQVEWLIKKYHVDLMLSGRNHFYERSFSVADGVVKPQGAACIYIGTGGGGNEGLYDFTDPPQRYSAARRKINHFTLLEVSPSDLVITAIDKDNVPFDHVVLRKHHGARSTAPAPTEVRRR